jgi:cellulose synthase operon protein C
VLAACQAAVGARSQVLHASLPASFIKAGARLVLASPTPVEDAEAGAFFEGVLARVRAGQPAAIALRDERQAPRWRHNQRSWTQDVVLFR